jgi:hypothetical protein
MMMAELSLTCTTATANVTIQPVTLPINVEVVNVSGLTLPEHETIDSLVHNLSEDTFQEIVRDGSGRVTNVNIYDAPGGTFIRSTAVTRDGSGQVVQVTEQQYDSGGSVIQTLTTNVTRSGGRVVSVDTDETELF